MATKSFLTVAVISLIANTVAAQPPSLRRGKAESAAAIEARLGEVTRFFDEKKKDVRPFADDILSLSAKAELTGNVAMGIIEQTGNLIVDLFGEKRVRPDEYGPKRFALYAERSFARHIFTSDQLRRAIDSAIAGYVDDLQALEGRLLVDFRVDRDFPPTRAPKFSQPERAIATRYRAVIDEAVAAAGGDLTFEAGKLAVSWMAGNKLSGQMTGVGDSALKKLGADLAAGVIVDGALDKAVAGGGYDPASAYTAKVARSLDDMRSLIIDGDPEAIKHYKHLCIYRNGRFPVHVRKECFAATRAMENSPYLGLRKRLNRLHEYRAAVRYAAIGELNKASDPTYIESDPTFIEEPDFFLKTFAPFTSVIQDRSSPVDPDSVLRFARDCIAVYGEEQP